MKNAPHFFALFVFFTSVLLPLSLHAQLVGPSIAEDRTTCFVGGNECLYGPNGAAGTCESVTSPTRGQYCGNCTGTGDTRTCTWGTFTSYDPTSVATYPGVLELSTRPSKATTCRVASQNTDCALENGAYGKCEKVRYPSTPRTTEYADLFCAVQDVNDGTYIFDARWKGIVAGSNGPDYANPRSLCMTGGDAYCQKEYGPTFTCNDVPGFPQYKECYVPGSRPTQMCDASTECPENYECFAGLGTGGKGGCLYTPRADDSVYKSSPTLINLLSVDTLQDLIAVVLKAMVQIGSIILVLMLMYVGWLFIEAQGQEEKIRNARSALVWTVFGGLLLLGAEALSLVIKSTIETL